MKTCYSTQHLSSAAKIVQEDLRYILNKLSIELPHLAGKNILVTGGAGFLGFYLVLALLFWNRQSSSQEKVHVTVYENYIRGMPQWLKNLASNSELSLVRQDMSSPLPDSMPDFSYIIHAASIASPTYYRKYPIETMDANVSGLRSLLEYAKQQKNKEKPVEGLLFFSTSEIYGDPEPGNIPTPETYRGYVSCTGPRACYDESKRYGEALCVNFAQQHGLPIKITRPFNNYGPGLKITDKRVIPDFARDILAGHNIVMHSNGTPSRTFCYVADAVVGYFKVMIRGRTGEAYNIGTEHPEISIARLAELMTSIARKKFNYQGSVIHQASTDSDYLVDNPNRRCPAIAKARHDLDYNPDIPIEEGLLRTLVWYNENTTAEES